MWMFLFGLLVVLSSIGMCERKHSDDPTKPEFESNCKDLQGNDYYYYHCISEAAYKRTIATTFFPEKFVHRMLAFDQYMLKDTETRETNENQANQETTVALKLTTDDEPKTFTLTTENYVTIVYFLVTVTVFVSFYY